MDGNSPNNRNEKDTPRKKQAVRVYPSVQGAVATATPVNQTTTMTSVGYDNEYPTLAAAVSQPTKTKTSSVNKANINLYRFFNLYSFSLDYY